MARISYLAGDSPGVDSALVARITGSRRGGVLNIYKLLLHAPALAATWLDHIGAVRWHTDLSGRLRELVIIRVAIRNQCAYALNQHVPSLALADGVSLDECEALKDWRPSSFFDDAERAALTYTDAMCDGPTVPDAAFEDLRAHFDERRIVEISVLIGSYLMHNRVFNALGVDLESAQR